MRFQTSLFPRIIVTGNKSAHGRICVAFETHLIRRKSGLVLKIRYGPICVTFQWYFVTSETINECLPRLSCELETLCFDGNRGGLRNFS